MTTSKRERQSGQDLGVQSQRQTQNGLLSHTITRTHVCAAHANTRERISFPFNTSTPCPLLAPFHLLFIIMRSCFPLLKAGALIVCFPLKGRPRGIMQQSLSLQRDLFCHRWELVLTCAASLSGRNSLHAFQIQCPTLQDVCPFCGYSFLAMTYKRRRV